MRTRRVFIAIVTVILTGAVFVAITQATEVNGSRPTSIMTLSNVRDYATAPDVGGVNYAVAGGLLFAGRPPAWTQVDIPPGVIVGAVALDGRNPDTVYIGAANELAIYRSINAGQAWLRVPLSHEFIGGVTDIAMDSFQRLVYVGTDTAGVFRLRDVGSGLILTSQLLLEEPVLEVVADSTGACIAYARTAWNLYRAENYGLRWTVVDNLLSPPTALVIANTWPPTLYVGTVDRGLLKSHDGLTWTMANDGLGLVPGSRLYVDALAVDAAQPDVLYVATSYLLGSTQVHHTPAGVAMSTNGAQAWTKFGTDIEGVVTELLPVTGESGAVYALTNLSRTPFALGNATVTTANVAAASETVVNEDMTQSKTSRLAWIVAGLAALALIFAIVVDLRKRRPVLTDVDLSPESLRSSH